MGVGDHNKGKIELLREYEMPFNKEHVWSNIQRKKKKRKGAFFLITMALVALAIVFFTRGHLSLNEQGQLSENHAGSMTEEFKSLNSTSISETVGEVIDEYTTEEAIEKNKSQEEGNSNSDRKERGINAKSFVPSANVQPAKFENKSYNERNDQKSEADDLIAVEKTNQYFESKSTIKTQSAVFEEALSDLIQQETPSLNESNSDKKQVRKGDILKPLEMRMIDLVYDPLDLQTPNFSESSITPVHNVSRFGFELYAGAGLPLGSKQAGDLDFDRDVLETLSAGASFSYQIKPSLYIRSGLEYGQYTERKVVSESEIFDISEVDSTLVGSLEGNWAVIISKNETTFTKYRHLSAPVLFGWNTNRERFNMFVELGAFLDFKSYVTGELLQGEEQIDNFQILPTLGVGASYKINKRVSLFSRFNYRSRRVIASDSEVFERGYHTIRTQVGLKYHL